jgi:hypothetical protein
MPIHRTSRRTFVGHALASVAILQTSQTSSQGKPEVANFTIDVPPKATLWGQVFFLSDEPVEVTFGAGGTIRPIRGHVDATRMAEYAWKNAGSTVKTVIVRARAMAGDRELGASVNFVAEGHIYFGFGRRGMPEAISDRVGSYPFEAVFVGFFLYGE